MTSDLTLSAGEMAAARRRLLELETPEMTAIRHHLEWRDAEMKKEIDRRLARMRERDEFDARRLRGEVSKEELRARRKETVSEIMERLAQQSAQLDELKAAYERLSAQKLT